jgi:GMP synthase (glutamine-hydrolysing)
MFVFVVTDSPENARRSGFYETKFTLEDLADDWCLMLGYAQVDPGLLAKLDPWAIVHSGGSASYDTYDVLEREAYRRVIVESQVAQIGLCGGHQIIAKQFGSSLGHMRRVHEDEPDLSPGYHAGWFKEWGVYPVRIVARDPLFDGLGDLLRVQEHHMDEVKDLGPDLRLLASSTDCRVQAFVHRQRPIYGVQFHPERASEQYPDGFQVLRNFLRIAREHHQESRSHSVPD